jgi:hypothetical protein
MPTIIASVSRSRRIWISSLRKIAMVRASENRRAAFIGRP